MIEQTTNEYEPSSISPPGETLAELLLEKGLTQAELARRLERPLKTINEIIKGKAAITPDTALQLERALGAPAEFWLARESHFREWQARERANKDLRDWAGWLKELPVREMTTFGWIKDVSKRTEKVSECLRFFGVASVEAWRATYERPMAAFRSSDKVKKNKGAVAAWLRAGELEATRVDCSAFDSTKFEESLKAVRWLTLKKSPTEFVPSLVERCRLSGVAVVFIRPPKGCPACGAARWITANKALIQLSLRYRTNDQLWFTFFHEAAHILLHSKTRVFVDDMSSTVDTFEAEADNFARDALIPPALEATLFSLELSRAAIVRFAEANQIAPGIVVGRMQKKGRLPWSHLNDLKVHYKWSDE